MRICASNFVADTTNIGGPINQSMLYFVQNSHSARNVEDARVGMKVAFKAFKDFIS